MPTSEKRHYRHRENHFLTRTARLLRLGRSESPRGNSPKAANAIDGLLSEKGALDVIPESSNLAPAASASDEKETAENAAVRENVDRRRDARTLPPWIHSLQQDESLDVEKIEASDMREPLRTKRPHHNYMPIPKHEPRSLAQRGRTWDHARSGDAVTMPFQPRDHGSRWLEFVDSSAYANSKGEEGEIVDDAWIEENIPDLGWPYVSSRHVPEEDQDEAFWLFSEKKRSATFSYFQSILMKNPFVPLIIRVTVMTFCLVALGLGVQIFRRSNSLNHSSAKKNTNQVTSTEGDYICKQQASTYMAFIIDSCAVIYLVYITYDEYFSKPLGLRSSKDKMRLLFLDLGFIIFSAANLGLAFSTLTDQQWSCFDNNLPFDTNINNAQAARSTCVTNPYLCEKQKGLVSVLLIAEVAWVMTFAISTLRIVERIQR